MRKFAQATIAVVMIYLMGSSPVTISGISAQAQELPKAEFYQAAARGQAAQAGRTFDVNIRITEYSTQEDQQILLDAFAKGGMKGLSNALGKMTSKGRLSITGTLGVDISYIRQWPTPNGRKIRIVTNRRIRFGETWYSTRSTDYQLSALELEINEKQSQSTGTLLPACQFRMNKQHEIELVNYKNPWKLVNIMER